MPLQKATWAKKNLVKARSLRRAGHDPDTVLQEIMEQWDEFQSELNLFFASDLEIFKNYFNDLFEDFDVGDFLHGDIDDFKLLLAEDEFSEEQKKLLVEQLIQTEVFDPN